MIKIEDVSELEVANVMARAGSPNWFIEFRHPAATNTKGELTGVVRETARDEAGVAIAMGINRRDQRASKKEAGKAALRIRAKLDEILLTGRKGMTLIEALERHMLDVKHKNRQSFDSKLDRLCAVHPDGFGGDTPLDEITSEKISAWKNLMLREGLMERTGKGWVKTGKPMKASTVNAYLKVLSRALHRANKAWNALKTVPYIEYANTKVDKSGKKVRYLTDAEEAWLLANANRHTANLVRFGLDTGGRKEEMLALTWEHVDLIPGAQSYVRFWDEVKFDKPRALPISDDVRDMLIEMRQAQIDGGYQGTLVDGKIRNLVFAYLGRYREWVAMSEKPFEALIDSAWMGEQAPMLALKGVSLHTLRHTFATRLSQGRMPMKELQGLMGHEKIHITADLYSHFAPVDENTAKAMQEARAFRAARQAALSRPKLSLVA